MLKIPRYDAKKRRKKYASRYRSLNLRLEIVFSVEQVYPDIGSGSARQKKIARFGHCVISSNELDLQSLTESPCYFFQGCNGRISFTVFQFADVGLSDTGFLA